MAIRSRTKSKGGSKRPLKSKRKNKSKSFQITGELAEIKKMVEKKSAPGVIRTASRKRVNYGRINSGILTVDLCLAGGFMRSRAHMIFGERSAGKSTLALLFCKHMQDMLPDRVAIWVDLEGTFDSSWAEKLGVDLERLLVVEPETGEHAVDLVCGLIRAEESELLIVDSVAMLTPMKEIAESAEKAMVGEQARLVGRFLRNVNQAFLRERRRNHAPTIVHLNQFRMKIGVMFGDPRTLPGGKALEFCTSQQVRLTNKEITNKDSEVIHNEHGVVITKDKTGGRLKEGKFRLIRTDDEGRHEGYIEQARTILSIGAKCGIVTGKYDLGRYGKHRSQDAVSDYLYENPEACQDLQQQIIDFYRNKWKVT